MTDRDAIRQALHDAIGWQRGLVDAYSHIEGAPEANDAREMIKRYRGILRRRYGIAETQDERFDRESRSVSILPTEGRAET